MVFLFGLNMAVGTHFTAIVGFMMGVGGLFMGENLANGVLFSLGLFWVGDIGEKNVVKGGVALSFNQEVGVIVQLSLNLLGHESVLL